MNRIWPNGKTRKEELTRRLDRAEQLLRQHMDPRRPLRYQCANHLADALGSLGKCLPDSADRALDAAEKAAAETEPFARPRSILNTLILLGGARVLGGHELLGSSLAIKTSEDWSGERRWIPPMFS
jgi:hypothetical protein